MIGLIDEEIQEAADKYKAVWEIDGRQLSKVEILQRQHARLRAPVQAQLKRFFELVDKVYNAPDEHLALSYLHKALSEEARE